MKIGPKYKIARRLDAPVFDKTQTQKFQLNKERKAKNKRGRRKPLSEYGHQLREKQKARYSYLLPERQFARYVKNAMSDSSGKPAQKLYERLELRLDNVVYRLGLAPTKSAARQMVSHGHICVNGKRMTIPSHYVNVGDVITVREGSANTKLFDELSQRLEHYQQPAWLSFDIKQLRATIEGTPNVADADLLFDIKSILEFYSR
jgi:small subunit ribosomal protein S4